MQDLKQVADILDGKLDETEHPYVKIAGWVQQKFDVGGVQFFWIRDGTGVIQVTIHREDVSSEVFQKAEQLTQESSVLVGGIVKQDKRAPGGYELQIKELTVFQIADEWPIHTSDGTEVLMDQRHFWLRSPRQVSILRVRAEVIKAARDYLDGEGFVSVDTPILTPSICEDTTTLFETEYFGRKAYLSQSGQLYNEADIFIFKKVYCYGPTFRAEKSRTRRHLTEFWMLEPEMAFMDHEDCIKVEEDLITSIVKRVLERRSRELNVLKRDLTPLKKVEPPFPRIRYTEAVEKLQKASVKDPKLQIDWGDDLGAPHERYISHLFALPVIVHRYPVRAKAFYMEPDPENPEVVLCNDLLAPEGYGEIIGASERISNYELLEQRLKEFGLPKEEHQWYLDLRRFGTIPHSGFGMGIERVVQWICNLNHIREAIPYPRTIGRLYP